MTNPAHDLRNAINVLRRSPGFAIASILVLALAVGGNTAIFSVIEAVILRPLPYRQPARICVLWKSVPARNIEWDWTSYPTIRDWQEQNQSFQDLAFVLRPEASIVTLHGIDGPEKIQASKVSRNFFEIMGVASLIGRTFSHEEADGAEVVVLSYGFWLRRFGGDRSCLGGSLQLDGRNANIFEENQAPCPVARELSRDAVFGNT